MPKVIRQHYTWKFSSDKLKALGYHIDTTFEESKDQGDIVSLAPSQMLRSILDIRHRTVNEDHIERLWKERQTLYKRSSRLKQGHGRKPGRRPDRGKAYAERMNEVQRKIERTMFIPDYITVSIVSPVHYKEIVKKGVYINGKEYRRFSCSAGQARNSVIVMVCMEIFDELERRINNDRDMDHPLAPSKFNAYFGLASSATQMVPEPRFIVVEDFESMEEFKANFCTETDWKHDDEMEVKEVKSKMTRNDGSGLISPQCSERWAKALGLDHIPAHWIIRQSFIKGAVDTFPIQEFCEEVNGGKYLVNTIYKDEHGDPIKADLRDVDVILSASQFKLWDSYKSMDDYVAKTHKNKLKWGITQYTPPKNKNTLTLNYQFIQTLDLGKRDVEELCEPFIKWIEGVSLGNRAYMLLFLLGVNLTDESIDFFLHTEGNWWMKALAAHEGAIKDPFIRRKIRELIIRRIQNGAMGEIFAEGNFQTMMADPYAFMQHVCGLSVTGLLKRGEHYSNYWNQKGVKQVLGQRSPLTYRSECVLLDLVKNEQTEKWYRYLYSGIIYPYEGVETVLHSGCDWDGDIVSTTCNPVMLRCVYKDELPVTYDAPKPQKKLFTKEDLQKADLFGMGSIIGSITNKSTAAYALLPVLEEKYGKDSDEVKLTYSRLQQCCVAQSKQID